MLNLTLGNVELNIGRFGGFGRRIAARNTQLGKTLTYLLTYKNPGFPGLILLY